MIEEEAIVAEIEAGGRVWVEKARQSACGSCAQPCATASVADYFDKTRRRWAVASPIELRPGDRVVLGLPEDALVKGALAVYLLPLLGLLAGSILGNALASSWSAATANAAAALGGGGGLAATIAFLQRSQALSRSVPQAVVLRKIG
jgi:sigma-E factor negative regulatory protein RseC